MVTAHARQQWTTFWGKIGTGEHAKILQGDPELTRQLADSLEFKKPLYSGRLSFEEKT